jgi:Cof subfamily protein (haloacid dehalogenase superfamily)
MSAGTRRDAAGYAVRPRLIATDLDGTLLRSDGSVSDRTRAALAAVRAAGVEVVLCTARPPRWLHALAHVVGDHGTVLCGNGAFVYDVPTRTVVHDTGFARVDVLAIVADVRASLPRAGFAVERRDGMRIERGYRSPHGEDLPNEVHVDSLAELDETVVGKLLVTCATTPTDLFLGLVAQVVGTRGIVAYSGVAGLAEVSAPGVTKAAALASWCQARGIPAEAVWAFGDMPNDLPMLRWSGRAFAVANAHPDVLALADDVAPSNDADGVAWVLERLL